MNQLFYFFSILFLPFVMSFCGNGQPLECSIPWYVNFIDENMVSSKQLFESACIFHDLCYRHGSCTFEETKESCDLQFLHRMEQICRQGKNGADRWICLANARLFFTGVQLFGDPYWVPQDCKICHYQNIHLQSMLSNNETQSKVIAMFDDTLYSRKYFQNESMSNESLLQHYLQEGIPQGRMGSLIFDPMFYLLRYYELNQLFGPNQWENATVHFVEWGQREGRQGSILFDPQWYLTIHSLPFNSTSYEELYQEYLTNGLPHGIAGSVVFDPVYYLQRYEDVAVGDRNSSNSFHEAAIHFVVQGIDEGRVGSAQFSVVDYLASNEELRNSIGNNSYYLAMVHYFVRGRQ